MLIWRISWDKTLAAKFRSFQHRKNDRKIFREINSLVTYLVNRWFHNIFVKQVWSRENFCNFHTLTVLLLCFIVEQQLSITLQNSSKHVMTFVQIIRYTTFSSVSYLKIQKWKDQFQIHEKIDDATFYGNIHFIQCNSSPKCLVLTEYYTCI